MRSFAVFLLATALFAGLATAQDVAVDDLSICKTALERIMPDVNFKSGFTVFCPTNDAFEDFAFEMGYEGDESDAEAFLDRSPAHLNLFRTILSYHITQGVTPLAKLSSGPLATLSGHSFEVVKEGDDDIELKHTWVDLEHEEPEANDEEYADALEGGDLTFEGPYQEGVSTYVVHAVEAVMVPKEVAEEARATHAAVEAASIEEYGDAEEEQPEEEAAAAGKAHRRLLHAL
ncbi:hypothetical protein Rsub_12892 [Raphidocelis subcapitata]|uniref:FAS1 domain-containing protein n=1 Tax=Raphidocelis subcapitata TaxID=307507 RepID=A0A2V0PRN7_9CHLO|nr:hypothetical protein Rsub_12892 [Raphidocelis subcapitata]|eukprot:GBG00248.1 hypothetical protein Rsub_12892 [Raphidocelis subcapitata]